MNLNSRAFRAACREAVLRDETGDLAPEFPAAIRTLARVQPTLNMTEAIAVCYIVWQGTPIDFTDLPESAKALVSSAMSQTVDESGAECRTCLSSLSQKLGEMSAVEVLSLWTAAWLAGLAPHGASLRAFFKIRK